MVVGRCVEVVLTRARIGDRWGISLAGRPGGGLTLAAVQQDKLAWRAGLRPGQAVLIVNGWSVVNIAKTEVWESLGKFSVDNYFQVGVHLLQAAAHQVKLGVLLDSQDDTICPILAQL